MADQGTSNLPPDELLLSEGQRALMHEVLTEGPAPLNLLEAIEEAARLSPDTLKIAAEAEAANPLVAKPLWARLGLGVPGLLLLVGQLGFAEWNRELGLGLEEHVPWLRLLALVIGGVMVVMAAPAPAPSKKIELKTRRW